MAWYTGNIVYDTVLACGFILVLLAILGTAVIKTPYGRFGSERFGIKMSPRLGWFLMELPAAVSFLFFFLTGCNPLAVTPLVFLCIWCIHYANRGFLFPYLIRVAPGFRQTFNFSVVASGWVVTTMHGYLNAAFITSCGSHFTISWLTDPRFIIGVIVYYSGFILNIHSDRIIRNLRPRGGAPAEGPRYKIPYGGAFRYVSSPQYLGELIAWTGFTICTWSLAGVFILSISAANLIPRAMANHAWYKSNFKEYPSDRKAILPYIL